MKVLHLAAHLGGGVGKAISGLSESGRSDVNVQRTIVLFEAPIKMEFVERIQKNGCRVHIQPTIAELKRLVLNSDIIQLEWWNHPATIKYLCELNTVPMRLLTWSHISGLGYFSIPHRLISVSQRFIFTSPCSLKSETVTQDQNTFREKLGVVHSSGGFDHLPVNRSHRDEPISAGYIGSLNFSKLHPNYIDFLSQVRIPKFQVQMIGDLINKKQLENQCKDAGRPDLLRFTGFVSDIIPELSKINVLVYLLNPKHYGTTENALLEAMAMGITPIVMNNECEASIIEHGETGIIVNDKKEFIGALSWLHDNPDQRIEIGKRAARKTRERFSSKNMETGLLEYYEQVITAPKESINFLDVFGSQPSEWFLLNQQNKSIFNENGSILLECKNDLYGLLDETKGSVFQFSRYFPNDRKLSLWSKNLRLSQ